MCCLPGQGSDSTRLIYIAVVKRTRLQAIVFGGGGEGENFSFFHRAASTAVHFDNIKAWSDEVSHYFLRGKHHHIYISSMYFNFNTRIHIFVSRQG